MAAASGGPSATESDRQTSTLIIWYADCPAAFPVAGVDLAIGIPTLRVTVDAAASGSYWADCASAERLECNEKQMFGSAHRRATIPLGERGEDTNLDRRLGLRAGCHHPEAAEAGRLPLHIDAGVFGDSIRKDFDRICDLTK
jgi:hypothetical protein